MGPFSTPARLEARSELYHRLATLLGAGIPILGALDNLQRSPPARALANPIRLAHAAIESGSTLTEALQNSGAPLPDFDLALLDAGERSGRIDGALTSLATFYREQSALARRAFSQMLYPAVILHVAIFLAPIQTLVIAQKPGAYFAQVLAALIPTYLILGLFLALASSGGSAWAVRFETVLHRVPLLGSARRDLAIARFSLALGALLDAGIGMTPAWQTAGRASGSSTLRRQIDQWLPIIDSGNRTPGELLASSPLFPNVFISAYLTGETAGKLDVTLRRLHAVFAEDASRKFELVGTWVPRLLYFGVLGFGAAQIISTFNASQAPLREILGP